MKVYMTFKIKYQCSTKSINVFGHSMDTKDHAARAARSVQLQLEVVFKQWASAMRSSGSSPSWAPPKVRPRSPPNCSSSCGCVDWVDLSTSTVYTLVNCTNEDQYKYTYVCYPNKVHISPGFDSWILYYNISCSDRAIYIYIFHDMIYYTQLRA